METKTQVKNEIIRFIDNYGYIESDIVDKEQANNDFYLHLLKELGLIISYDVSCMTSDFVEFDGVKRNVCDFLYELSKIKINY